ncbi:peptidyl-prolyl cis-trans isomerase SurA [Rhizobium sp. SG_E_25_P2]|nr:peptidyl-prolyl cis-trans isomerase SurA [Rhizobium sp. SG_E_25_P2]
MTLTRFRALVAGAVIFALSATLAPEPAMAAGDGVAAIVNGVVITDGDVAKRAAFLRLRRAPGAGAQKAREELVNETLMRNEIIRVGASVSTDDVDAAFARFAGSNKMTVPQLTQILSKAGVTAEHFKSYIGIQMSWPRAVNSRYGASGQMSAQDFIVRLQKDNGKKPVTNEYILQQVIFVIPASKKGKITGKRKSEAEASRKQYPGCAGAKAFAAGLHDVSIREIGRVLEPQLPAAWKDDLLKTSVGGTTRPQVTDRGVEYIAVCKKREVSDDFAAQVVYQAQDLEKAEKQGQDPNSVKYLDELRKRAQIELR